MASQSLAPSIVVSGGYSGYNPGGKTSGVEFGRLRGWNSTATIQFTPRYSFVADFGRYSNSTVGSTQSYLFGPKFTFHKGALAPFAEVMMGFQHQTPKSLPSYIAFSEAVGGGLDIAVARRFSVRLFQADFIYAANHEKTKLELNQFYGVRVSAGIVWNLGRPRKPTVAKEKSPSANPPAAQPTVETAKQQQPAPAAPAPTEAEAAKPQESAPTDSTKADETSQPSTSEATKSVPAVESPAAEAKPATASRPQAVETSKAYDVPQGAEASATDAAQTAAPTQTGIHSEEAAVTTEAVRNTAPSQPNTEEKSVEKKEAQPANKQEQGKSERLVASTEKPSEAVVTPPENVASAESVSSKVEAATQPVAPATATASNTAKAVQHVGTLRFPYDQYPTLLSPSDKRSLDAVASRLKLEPESSAVIVGTASSGSPSATAAQRAVNSKEYLVGKGIAADRVKVFERPSTPAPTKTVKSSPSRTELVFVPGGATYDASATPVDEQHVKPQHLHVAHPEWREK